MPAERTAQGRPTAPRVGGIVWMAAGIFLAVSFATYTPADVPLLTSHPLQPPRNVGGIVGVWVGWIGRGGFGWASGWWVVLCLLWGQRLLRRERLPARAGSLALGSGCLLGSMAALLALSATEAAIQSRRGGVVGLLLARCGVYYLGAVGTLLAAGCVGVLSWLVVSGGTLGPMGRALIAGMRWVGRRCRRGVAVAANRRLAPRTAISPEPGGDRADTPAALRVGDVSRVRLRAPVERSSPPSGKPTVTAAPQPRLRPGGDFRLPAMELLVTPPATAERQRTEDLQRNAGILEETLREFGVEASVVNIDRGPAVTRYELTPAPGVKLTKIVSLADDLALVMKAASCHVIAPIPGKGRVGIDVPNTTTTIVSLKDILTTPACATHPSPLALPIGKDIAGQPVVTDLRECPHLLIAGATGSGKTVCLNSLLIGMLMRVTPAQVRFLLIDPKMVELAMFKDIPHLMAPVVTQAKQAGMALHWAVEEMERRYQLLAKAGVRNIELYNARRREALRAPTPSPGAVGAPEGTEEDGRPLPYVVIVIDELADLMMVAAQDVEGAIARLAQLSRAVGLHVILATQRPSVDVITGVIKANFPARVAFQVASKVDSRTILDANGADKLLGRGDLLFLPPGSAKPIRAQGAWVSDAEIERVTAFLKQQAPPSYDARWLERVRQPDGEDLTAERDELYETAKQLVVDTGQASTSLLQRRLRLGYGRAARMLDLMEQEGVVGPPQGSRPREVLLSVAAGEPRQRREESSGREEARV